MTDRKALRRQYQETPRPAGLFAVRNTTDGRMLIGTSRDVPATLNSQRFKLDAGMHPDKALQADWSRLGASAFAFEMLDELEPPAAPDGDIKEDLEVLRDVWLEKLAAAGQRFYPSSAPERTRGPIG